MENSFPNAHLGKLEVDHLYHIGFSTKTSLEKQFSDVQFVCLGGTVDRMKSFAHHLKKLCDFNDEIVDIAGHGHRYSMYKVGPVLSVSHGMGAPSLSILLHELIKLIQYAKCKNVTFIRIGTSGGLGVDPGTIVVSTGAVNDLLEEHHSFHILGKIINAPCNFDRTLTNEIVSTARDSFPDVTTICGKTMCASDFYEAQGRTDGAFCNYTEEDRKEFLHRLIELEVKNIEMEATVFSAMCSRANLRSAVVCVTLVNRLVSDQVTEDTDRLTQWQKLPQLVVGEYIKKKLGI